MVGSLRIIVLDDDTGFLKLVEQIIMKNQPNASIFLFNWPEVALSMIMGNREGFDLVVSDYQMPSVTGLDVWYTLRKNSLHTKFLLTSGEDPVLPIEFITDPHAIFLPKVDLLSENKGLEHIVMDVANDMGHFGIFYPRKGVSGC